MAKSKVAAVEHEIVYRDVHTIHEDPQNARLHSEEQIDIIMHAIQETGVFDPIDIDENGMILAGAGRKRAAVRMGRNIVPTIQHTHMNEDQKMIYALAANQTAIRAGWKNDTLADNLKLLNLKGVNLGVVGFEEPQLKELMTFKAGELKVLPLDETKATDFDEKKERQARCHW
jgi:ParB family chromosome partitioning protein